LRRLFYAVHEKPPFACSAAAPFRKMSRSDFLLTCKRVRDENLSLPTFCGTPTAHFCVLYRRDENAVRIRGAAASPERWERSSGMIFE